MSRSASFSRRKKDRSKGCFSRAGSGAKRREARRIPRSRNTRSKLEYLPLESYLPAFPIWAALTAPIENHLPWHHIVRESVSIDSKEIQVIRKAALANRAFVSFGFSEKIPQHSAGCLYNSNILIGDTGEILVHHRKLVYFEQGQESKLTLE